MRWNLNLTILKVSNISMDLLMSITHPAQWFCLVCWRCPQSWWRSTCIVQNRLLSCCPKWVCKSHLGPQWWCDEDPLPRHARLFVKTGGWIALLLRRHQEGKHRRFGSLPLYQVTCGLGAPVTLQASFTVCPSSAVQSVNTASKSGEPVITNKMLNIRTRAYFYCSMR